MLMIMVTVVSNGILVVDLGQTITLIFIVTIIKLREELVRHHRLHLLLWKGLGLRKNRGLREHTCLSRRGTRVSSRLWFG